MNAGQKVLVGLAAATLLIGIVFLLKVLIFG